jgi:transporter family-2 protein
MRRTRAAWMSADSVALSTMNTEVVAPTAPSRTKLAVSAVLAFVCGSLVVIQSRINGELGVRLSDGFLAALISFTGGLVLIGIWIAFSPRGKRGVGVLMSAVRERQLPFWYLFAGAAGAFLVLSQGLVAGILGVALFATAVVTGQTISGLLLDRRGFGAGQAKPVTPQRIVGAALALVAVVLAGSTELTVNIPVWMLVLPFIGGLGLAWQQGANGLIGATAGSPLTATLFNFAVGTTVLLLASIVEVSIVGWPTSFPTEPWLYTGGILGVAGIALATVLVRITGVLVFGLCLIAGQLITSLIADIVLPVSGHGVTVTTVIGSLLTLVAVGIAAIPARQRS